MAENCQGVAGKTLSIYGTEMALFKLDLSGKELREMPEDGSLKEIRSLDVSANQLPSLDFVLKCPNAIEINASENQISDGLQMIGDLEFIAILNLSANLFESLNGFPVSETLIRLNLSRNNLSTVSDLPPLPFLEELNLSHNSIKDLQLPELPALKVLNISGNAIESLSLPKLPSLRVLDASCNMIETIQEFEDDSLPFIWSCDLRNNAIATADVFRSIAKLPMLYTLFIAENPVAVEDKSYIAPVLVILPKLIHLDGKLVNAKDKVKSILTVSKEESGRIEDNGSQERGSFEYRGGDGPQEDHHEEDHHEEDHYEEDHHEEDDHEEDHHEEDHHEEDHHEEDEVDEPQETGYNGE